MTVYLLRDKMLSDFPGTVETFYKGIEEDREVESIQIVPQELAQTIIDMLSTQGLVIFQDGNLTTDLPASGGLKVDGKPVKKLSIVSEWAKFINK